MNVWMCVHICIYLYMYMYVSMYEYVCVVKHEILNAN